MMRGSTTTVQYKTNHSKFKHYFIHTLMYSYNLCYGLHLLYEYEYVSVRSTVQRMSMCLHSTEMYTGYGIHINILYFDKPVLYSYIVCSRKDSILVGDTWAKVKSIMH